MNEFELLRFLSLGIILIFSLGLFYVAWVNVNDLFKCKDALKQADHRIIRLEHENFELRVEKEFNAKKVTKVDQE